VACVGWDDAYAASNFATAPPGPGAFLVRRGAGPPSVRPDKTPSVRGHGGALLA